MDPKGPVTARFTGTKVMGLGPAANLGLGPTVMGLPTAGAASASAVPLKV